ncbi:hypothetical protein HMPREF0175_1529, partial [Bifidobacterium longum subsp. longum ATCC 55813]
TALIQLPSFHNYQFRQKMLKKGSLDRSFFGCNGKAESSCEELWRWLQHPRGPNYASRVEAYGKVWSGRQSRSFAENIETC